jgi:pyridoxamine 5'-phosphate oxidase
VARRAVTHNVFVSDYGQPLRGQDVDPDPLRQFSVWFGQAGDAGLRMPEAAALASASAEGIPSARMVLVKSFDERGFVFYSNYTSRKGRELEANPRAALLFYWDPLGRQVRIEGSVERTSAEESAAYIRTRPRGSQLSVLASAQSRAIESRDALEARVAELQERYGDGELPLPGNWGGFRLAPDRLEFWQQRHDRLHDRLLYSRGVEDGWAIERLAP